MHGIRRHQHPAQEAPTGHGLRSEGGSRPDAGSAAGLHPGSHSPHRERDRYFDASGGGRDQAVRREVLLGWGHGQAKRRTAHDVRDCARGGSCIGQGVGMLGVPRTRMPAIARSRSSQSLRIALTHAVRFAVLAAMLSMSLAAQTGTPLTLPEAVSLALEKNPLHKAAMADTRISAAAIREARSPLMPKIMFTESAVRGNDPVFVFGTRLRQQSFTAADFALNKLNTPTPIGNFSSRFSGQWSLFDGLQSWFGVSRAKYLQQAAAQQLGRTDQELVYQAVQAYFGVLLAQKQEQVAQDAWKTPQAIEASSQVRVESGMAVDSDQLSAQVVTSQRKQELIQMRDGLALARAQLALALGMRSEERRVGKECR